MTEENMNNEKTIAELFLKEENIFILDTNILLLHSLFSSFPIHLLKLLRPYLINNSTSVMFNQVSGMTLTFTFEE